MVLERAEGQSMEHRPIVFFLECLSHEFLGIHRVARDEAQGCAGIGNNRRERLKVALVESIQLHLVADVPLGVFLSGGIDSTAVAAVASRATNQSIKTFNVAFDETRFDESSHARTASNPAGARGAASRTSAAA